MQSTRSGGPAPQKKLANWPPPKKNFIVGVVSYIKKNYKVFTLTFVQFFHHTVAERKSRLIQLGVGL